MLLTGDMGIANTTPAAALIAAFTGPTRPRSPAAAPASTTRRSPARSRWSRPRWPGTAPDPADPLGVLAAVGGLEHAALAGFILGGARPGAYR